MGRYGNIRPLTTLQAIPVSQTPHWRRVWKVKETVDANPTHGGVVEAMHQLYREYPNTYLMSQHLIRANLQTVVPPEVYRPRAVTEFIAPWNEPFNFHMDQDGNESPWRRSIVLYGPPRTGKTCRACAEFDRPFVVTNSNLDALKDLVRTGPHAHTHIVFDEFNFKNAGLGRKELSPEEALSLLSSEHVVQIRVLYGCATVPPIPRIFTTNLQPEAIFPRGETPEQMDGLAARIRAVLVEGRLFA